MIWKIENLQIKITKKKLYITMKFNFIKFLFVTIKQQWYKVIIILYIFNNFDNPSKMIILLI